MSFYEFLCSAPYVRILFPFIMGILLGQYISVNQTWVYNVILLLFLIASFFQIARSFSLRWIWGLLFNVTVVFIGLFINTLNKTYDKISEGKVILSGTVIENPVIKRSGYCAIVRINAINEGKQWKNSNSKIICTLQKKDSHRNLKLNQQIVMQGYLKLIRNFGNPFEFDYKRYMNLRRFYYRAYIDSGNWHIVGENDKFKLTIWALKLRNKILTYFGELNLGHSAFAVVSALTVGDKSYLDPELKSVFINTGTIHILAVSGMHVALLFWFLNQLTRPIINWKRGKIIRFAIVICVIWIYALITGLTPSVVRASVMFSFWMIGDISNRNINIYNTLCASALLLLVINPQTLFDVGFQLSYMAVLGIVVFYNDIYNWITVKNILIKYIWSMIAVSFAAQLFTIPLTLYYFHQFPNYFLLSNIVALPLSSIILFGSILILVLAPFKILWILAGAVLKFLADFMNNALNWIEQLPFSVTSGISVTGIAAFSIFLIIIAVRVYLYNRKAYSIFVILICFIVFSAGILQKKIKTFYSFDIIVYNASGPIIQIRDGSENYLVTKSSEAYAEKIIKPYNDYYHLESCRKIFLDTDNAIVNNHFMFYKNFLVFRNKKMFIWEKKPNIRKLVDVDVLIINKIKIKDIDSIDKLFRPGMVLITPGVFRNNTVKLKEFLKKKRIPFWILNTEGAWMVSQIKKNDE